MRIPDVYTSEWVGTRSGPRSIELLDELEMGDEDRLPDLIVFSRQTWDAGFGRVQRLMTRFARDRRVFFVEEAMVTDAEESTLDVSDGLLGVKVLSPRLSHRCRSMTPVERDAEISELLLRFTHSSGIVLDRYTAWYDTPIALGYTRALEPTVVIYDCTEDFSANPAMRDLEWELIERADLVFTESYSMCMAKMYLHPSVHVMPNPTVNADDSRAWGTIQARMARLEREAREMKLGLQEADENPYFRNLA